MADKLIGHVVPVRFAIFALIGGLGVVAHLAVLWYCFKFIGLNFDYAQTVATISAMTSIFFLNNLFTYRDRRIRGWRILRRLASFYCICAAGAIANIGIGSFVFATIRRGGLPGWRALPSGRSGITRSRPSLSGSDDGCGPEPSRRRQGASKSSRSGRALSACKFESHESMAPAAASQEEGSPPARRQRAM
jgi:putative flippase GtrA